jgi:hypothetical protein
MTEWKLLNDLTDNLTDLISKCFEEKIKQEWDYLHVGPYSGIYWPDNATFFLKRTKEENTAYLAPPQLPTNGVSNDIEVQLTKMYFAKIRFYIEDGKVYYSFQKREAGDEDFQDLIQKIETFLSEKCEYDNVLRPAQISA